jgi:AP-2 complex subunit mu-1
MIGVLLVLNSRGDVVLSKAYRENFNIRTLAETFRSEVIATKKAERNPIEVFDKVCFLHLRYENLFLVACSGNNVNAVMTFQYLIRVLQLVKGYFGFVNEETFRENFVSIQELLDESMDYGYPQLTEIDVLKSYINAGGARGDVLKRQKESEQITIKATGKIPWRKEGLTYHQNEVFLDVIEDVNLLMSQSGDILHREVTGRVVMKGFLSGMPECKVCLNDKAMMTAVDDGSKPETEIDLDDVTFHQCVRLGKFDSDRSISFIPPDGEFVLMRYRTSGNVNPPLRVFSSRVKEVGKTRLEMDFRVKAEFTTSKMATDVVIRVPCPPNTANVKVIVSSGKAKHDAPSQSILWRIKRLPGGTELSFSCEISLIQSTLQSEKTWSRPPISMKFQVSMYAASGLSVVYLKVSEPKLNYNTVKWVRYISTAGQYECRI